MIIKWLGLIDYIEGVKAQDVSESSILGMEHPTTITLGKRGDPLKDIQATVRVLREKKVPIVGVDRGGQAVLHAPGQLVIYPLIHLHEWKLKVRDYVHLLEDVTKRFLSDYGIEAMVRGDEPGLHTIQGKIAFFGVRIRKGWTSHGLAINVHNHLDDFALIRCCGRTENQFSRMSDFTVNAPLEALFLHWCTYFETALHLTLDVNRPMVKKPLEMRV